MKRLYLLLLLSMTINNPLHSQEFIIGAEWLDSLYQPLTMRDWTNVADLGLNWGVVGFYGAPLNNATTTLYDANTHNVKLILERFRLDTPAVGQRWQYHPEYSQHYPLSGRIGDPVADAAKLPEGFPDDNGNNNKAWLAEVEAYGSGYMATGLLVDNEQKDSLTYWLKVRLRLEQGTPLNHTEVITIKAVRKSDGQYRSFVLYADDPQFGANYDWTYKEITAFSFWKSITGSFDPPGSFIPLPMAQPYGVPGSPDHTQPAQGASYTGYDYQVYWHRQVTCYLDYVMVDDSIANKTFTGTYDNTINDEVNVFKSYPALGRFKIHDEPYPSEYLATAYVESKIRANVEGSGYPTKTGHQYNTGHGYGGDGQYVHRNIYWTRNNQNASDIYPINVLVPMPDAGNYTTVLQGKIQDSLITFLKWNIMNANQYAIPFWFTPQLHGWDFWQTYLADLREPTIFETKMMVNLGIAYGAKGIIYFTYRSFPPEYNCYGLVDLNGNPRHTIYGGYSYQGDKWATVKSINQKLAGLGPTLIGLTWQGAKSWNNGVTAGSWAGKITNLTTNVPGETKYVETGHFTASGLDYFFVVNRRTIGTESRDITLTLNNTEFKEIQEISSGKKWIIGSYGTFTNNFAPGDGKLYKVSPMSYSWSGDITVMNTVTVPSGTTLTVSAGSTLRFQPGIDLYLYGRVTAVGAWNNRIAFTSTGGQSPASWGSIILDGSGASGSFIQHADILYGHRIYVVNTSNFAIQASNILVTNWGIEFSGSTGSILQCTLTQPTYFHGIVIQNGSTVTCNQNTLTKQQPYLNRGFGLLYNSGSGGNVYQNDIDHWSSGVGAIWGSSPQFYCATNNGINNRIKNCNLGVEVYGWSYPVICPDLAYEFWYWWGNSIYGNGYNVALNTQGYNASELPAQLTWWGETPYPSMFAVGSGSNVDYDNWFDYDPWDYGFMAQGGDQSANNRATQISQAAQSSEEDKESVMKGTLLRLQGKFREAKDYFLSYLAKYPNDQAAYVELYNCYTEETAAEITKYFECLPPTAAKEHSLLLGYLYLKQGKVELAKQTNDAIIQGNPNTPLAAKARLNNFYIALHHEKNLEQASTLLSEVSSKAELTTEIDLSLAQQAFETFGTKGTPMAQASGVAQSMLSVEKTQEPSNASLDIYPNPFNPATALRYNVANEGFVSLKVYDILGREIANLVDDIKSVGSYSATWDASRFPSGIYFARLETSGHVLLKKLMLVK